MRLIYFTLLVLLFIPVTLSNAESPDTPFVQALEAALSIEDKTKSDAQITDVITESLFNFDNVEFAKNSVQYIRHPIFKSEILAKIGYIQSKQNDCKDALKYLGLAYDDELRQDLGKELPHYRAEIALRYIVEGYSFCDMTDKAEKIALLHKPQVLKEKQYLANVYSAIGAAQQIKNNMRLAKEYFDKALSIARPILDETHRSDALRNIAKNQIVAGLYDQALNTAAQIKPTNDPSKGRALPFSSFKNKVLVDLACYYLSLNDFETANRILIRQSVLEGNLYPPCLVDFFVSEAKALDTDKAIKALDIRYASLLRYDKNREILKIAKAHASLGNKTRALIIMDRLFQDQLKKYTYEKEDYSSSSPAPSILWLIDDIIQAYIVVSKEDQWAYEKLTTTSLSDLKAYNFNKSWGALIGLSADIKDKELRNKVDLKLGNEAKLSSILFGTFQYYIEIDDMEAAIQTIQTMEPIEKSGAYLMFAREELSLDDYSYLDFNKKF
tara:strand:- start:1276 stop:2769 length:1494 start_codon:yes stop_codon:yes gene_type:complete